MNVHNWRPRFERRFYLGISLVFLALVFWTFARTFYLKAFFTAPALSPLLHIHGVVMSGWVVLLVVQTSLIAAHRVQWHRRLGVFGAGWAVLVVILGSVTTVHAAAREVRGHTAQAAEFVTVMGLDLLQMLFFAGFVAAAICLRRRSDYHKRLMLLTIACLLPDALARLPGNFMTDPLILLGMNGWVLACVGIDTLRHHRLHPVLGWGGAVFLGAFNLALPLMNTPAWITFASRLVS
ncbi:MAG: hypothetical protein ACRER7_08330 [Gammaproteobacteria bacterium]